MRPPLPIDERLGALRAALAGQGRAVLVAPPGAGKTTAVAPALLEEDWCEGRVIVTAPRRVAARAAAERMAENLGERVGERIGYVTRLDRKIGANTRIVVMTEAIFVNTIVEDPELKGVSAVLFDEAHERHLDGDLGLALCIEARGILRPDLRLCVMSATIDGARFARLLGDETPVIESKGRAFPLRIEWLGSPAARTGGRGGPDDIAEAMAEAIALAWRREEGDILAFLPGVGEIARTAGRLETRVDQALVLQLHGQLDPAAQRRAIMRDRQGRRRIVLATAIAETSITLDGVSVVVDSGLARRAEYDQAAGTTHLVTHRASQASAAQRAGRAARQRPGVAYRLWEEASHAGRAEFDPPEIELGDLAPLLLTCARWGARDPRELAWLDPPGEAALQSARERLQKLGALNESGGLTRWGERLARMPLDPVSAAAVLHGALAGQAQEAARLVLLVQERALGGRGEDLLARLARFERDSSARAKAARALTQRWARLAERLVAEDVGDGAHGVERAARQAQGESDSTMFLARARPDFVARRRDGEGRQWLSASGRGFSLDPASPLTRAEYLVIADASGQRAQPRITAAAQIEAGTIEDSLGEFIEEKELYHWNKEKKRVEARIEKRLGAIVLTRANHPDPDSERIVDILVDKFVDELGTRLPADLRARARFAGIDALSLDSLARSRDEWLRPLLAGRRDLDLAPARLRKALLDRLDWAARKALDERAPAQYRSPAGTSHAIDYAGPEAPSVELRVQAVFGLDRHPTIGAKGGETPLLLKLTSPAGRPIQRTRDLPGFWRSSWTDVRKEMKGRYPKHRWPERPWEERASLKTAKRFDSDGA